MKRILKQSSKYLNLMKCLKCNNSNSTSVIPIDGRYANLKEYACSYLLIEGNEAIIVDPITNNSIPYILQALEDNNLSVDQVKYIIITHIHLDHAGGTALLCENCKNAKVLAHPKSAKFLIEPEGIINGATMVYGSEKFNELYGEIKPVNEDLIIAMEDNERIKLGERELTFLHTLGHSTHHMVIYDDKTNGCFTGDNFGMNYPKFGKEYILPSTTPIDFDPNEMLNGIDIIMNTGADKAYLTHFGVWDDMIKGAELNRYTIERFYEIIRKIPEKIEELDDDDELIKWAEDEQYKILEEMLELPREILENDIPINNDAYLNGWGSIVYVQRCLKKGLEV